ncbi:hypothetical protein Taro_017243 [Colocasia esculenta]|uniref:CDPK-related kinase 3 n=1 Tax=Colocasia esculenta TaxID=4460 RepID=A0A843UMK3_COLES|nr:hypothetical protein [Colocasia esculenta]
MGQCYGKNIPVSNGDDDGDYRRTPAHRAAASSSVNGVGGGVPAPASVPSVKSTPTHSSSSAANPWSSPFPHGSTSPWPSPYPHGVSSSPLPPGVSPSPARSTPRRIFRWPFPPPSPAKHIKASIARRQGPLKPKDSPIPEDGGVPAPGEAAGRLAANGAGEQERPLDKSFGYGTNFGAKYELGKEVGRGHFGHTCSARAKKGEIKGQLVAVKIISKAKVLCEGGELLDRILSRDGRYSEHDAKAIVVQILSVVAFCHLQGVVHRDLKPENFLFTSKEENSPMKLIDFGLSDFIRPDERLNDVVGSAYYVAPEVLHRSYSMEADIWSIGVITYILLCGSRPFWARTESGIFRAVLRADPNFDDSPWPTVSPEAKDFVKRLLNKDYRKRMTAAQALTHPWLRNEQRPLPLDVLIYKLVKSYVRATPFKRAALKALSKALTEDELIYLRSQFKLLEPNKDGRVSLENFRTALLQNSTDAMKESRVPDIFNSMETLSYRRMSFEEFCAAAISPYQLEALEGWEQIASTAFEYFEEEGNRVISVEELAQELNLASSAYSVLRDWIRRSDGKLSFLGYTKFLHGVTIRSNTRHNGHGKVWL